MKFIELKKFIEYNIQDSPSKEPSKFEDWNLLIKQAILSIAKDIDIDELIIKDENKFKAFRYIIDNEQEKIFVKVPENLNDKNSELNVNERVCMAVVYEISSLLTKDINLKQKYIQDKQDVISAYLYKEYHKKELSR